MKTGAPKTELSPIDQGIIDLLHSVKEAQEQEITDRARISVEHDNRLEMAVSWPAVLARDAFRLGERMLYLYRHQRVARRIGQRMIPREYVLNIIGGRADEDETAYVKQYNAEKRREATHLTSPLLIVSEAEHFGQIEGSSVGYSSVVHGWYFKIHASGGDKPKRHTVRSVDIVSSYRDIEAGQSTDHVEYDVRFEKQNGVVVANLRCDPPSHPMPARSFDELPDEAYQLPVGLLREAAQQLGAKRLW